MKLGEAKKRLKLINREISKLEVEISYTPKNTVADLLENLRKLLAERQSLSKSISNTNCQLKIDSTATVFDVYDILGILRIKESIYLSLMTREDLKEEDKSSLYKELCSIREAKNRLAVDLETCFWETELLE